MEQTKEIQQNIDTNFLKLIAIICMVIDHIGKIFFPNNVVMAIIGRIAFPLFAYCVAVGCLYTKSINKYILRLLVFAVISQPFFVLAFHPTWNGFFENFLVSNIFFTLVAGVLAVNAMMNLKKHWWMLLIVVAMEILIGLDYGFYGIILIVIFYLCRNKSWLSALLTITWMMWSGMFGDYLYIGFIGLDIQFFALLALPLIYIHTNINPRINKYFFYIFYPAHFLIIFLLRIMLKV